MVDPGVRAVRRRIDTATAAASAAGVPTLPAQQVQAPPVPVSPLITILERGVVARSIVKDPRGEVYTGFATYNDLASSACTFSPMNSNRAINQDVVHKRVEENINAYSQTKRYLEFGQINLLIVAADASHDFLIMDGQHRCEVMRELNRRFPDRQIQFQFRAKVVHSEPLAFEELTHFQRCYPTDSRSFFRSRADARVATAVLQRLKAVYCTAFKDMVLADRRGRGTGDPPRPYLNDNLIFWLLQDSGLLASAVGDTAEARGSGSAAAILAALQLKDQALSILPKSNLGKGATDHMLQVASRFGCWLGFFREGVLHWRDVADTGAARVPAVSEHAAAPGAECTVCLERPAEAALLPCGHRCVCLDCAAAVRAARPPQCPLCRVAVADSCRIYL